MHYETHLHLHRRIVVYDFTARTTVRVRRGAVKTKTLFSVARDVYRRDTIHGAPAAPGATLGLPFPIPPKCTVS